MNKPDTVDPISQYSEAHSTEHGAICNMLRAEIDAAIPGATSKVWHGSPVWFIGENPVVGYSVTARSGVSLLFWNGKAIDEAGLKPVGKYGAAQVLFGSVSEIDPITLRRWLNLASTNVFDSRGFFAEQRAKRKQAAERI